MFLRRNKHGFHRLSRITFSFYDPYNFHRVSGFCLLVFVPFHIQTPKQIIMKLKSLLGTALLATSFFLISCGGKDKKEGDDKASTAYSQTITDPAKAVEFGKKVSDIQDKMYAK